MIAAIGMCSWSASSTNTNDYTSFVISRWLAGTFASVGTALGAGIIFDIFYLHQRGKAFACYGVGLLFGPVAGSTFSGFIVATRLLGQFNSGGLLVLRVLLHSWSLYF